MDRPVFIMGCPRSGTTIAMKIMARHESFAWVSNYVNRARSRWGRGFVNRVYGLPQVGHHLYLEATYNGSILPRWAQRLLPSPVEPWLFWTSQLENFRWERGGDIPPRRRTPHDITEQEIVGVRKMVDSLLRAQGKDRFISKYTDFPRMVYLSQAFPDALFVHIVRDGRAVAASYHKMMVRGLFGAWDEREWWLQGWPVAWRDEWQSRYGDPLSFAAYQWRFNMRTIRQDIEELSPGRCLEVRYRDMTERPLETLDQILDFCDLGPSENVMWYLDHITLKNMNFKWMETYSDGERTMLDQIIREPESEPFLDE